jgi:hypothetical protein
MHECGALNDLRTGTRYAFKRSITTHTALARLELASYTRLANQILDCDDAAPVCTRREEIPLGSVQTRLVVAQRTSWNTATAHHIADRDDNARVVSNTPGHKILRGSNLTRLTLASDTLQGLCYVVRRACCLSCR